MLKVNEMDCTSKYELVSVKKLRDEKWNSAIVTSYYKDGVKHVDFEPNPTVQFYTTKLDKIEKWNGKHMAIIPKEDCEQVECPMDEVFDQIVALEKDFNPELAEKHLEYLNKCRRSRKNPENLYMLNHVHGADVDPTDHYIDRFYRKTGPNEHKNIRKGYWDIESDGVNYRRMISPEEHSVPVNAISFLDKTTHTLVLRLLDCEGTLGKDYEKDNPLIAEFKNNLEENRLKIKAEVNARQHKIFDQKDEKTGEIIPTTLPEIEVEIKFYHNDIDLITEHFQDLRDVYGIDLLMAFNQSYDLNFSFGRIRDALGYEELCRITSDEAVPKNYQDCWYMPDMNAIEVSKRNDKYSITAPWTPFDLQYLYFKIRESMQKPEEYNLNYVLQTELDITKVEYDWDICDFPYMDYFNFVLYSAIDTCGLYWLDLKTLTSDTMMMFMELTRTRPDKTLTKTISLRNFEAFFYDENNNLIVSNNRRRIKNKIKKEREANGQSYSLHPELDPYLNNLEMGEYKAAYEIAEESDDDSYDMEEIATVAKSKKVKFRGAFVADPNLMENVGTVIFKKLSKLIYDWCADIDLSSLYPSIKSTWNIFIGTLIGKILKIDNPTDINFSAEIADFIVSRDNIAIGKKYFDLPSTSEYLTLFEEFRSR